MSRPESDPAGSLPSDEAQRILEGVRQVVNAAEDVQFAYLFGSWAKGRTRAASDVDVAVHLEGHPDPSARLDRQLDLESVAERALGRPVQVVVLNDAPLELRFNVLAHGIPLAARDDLVRQQFYVDTGRRYYDMAPARALFRRRQRERIREGTFGDRAGHGTAAPRDHRAAAVEAGPRSQRCPRRLPGRRRPPRHRRTELRGLREGLHRPGLHILADLPRPLPETYRGVFAALAKEGTVADDLATRLERMAGFRNILAPGYTELIAERVHAALGELDDIRAYVAAVSEQLEA